MQDVPPQDRGRRVERVGGVDRPVVGPDGLDQFVARRPAARAAQEHFQQGHCRSPVAPLAPCHARVPRRLFLRPWGSAHEPLEGEFPHGGDPHQRMLRVIVLTRFTHHLCICSFLARFWACHHVVLRAGVVVSGLRLSTPLPDDSRKACWLDEKAVLLREQSVKRSSCSRSSHVDAFFPPAAYSFRSRPLQLLLQAHEAARADDEVVDQLDFQDGASLDQLPRGVQVVRGGERVAAGVVVADDDAGAVGGDGGAEDLGDAQDGAVDGALVAQDVAHHLVLAVQEQDAQLFVVQVGHLHHQQVRRVGGRVDAVLLFRLQRAQAPPDLQGGLQLRRLGPSHAVFGAQLAEVGPHQPGEAAVPGQELARQLEGVVASGTRAQGDGEQFRRREGRWPRVLEALAGLLVRGQVAHGRVVF